MGKKHYHKLGRGYPCLATTCEGSGREYHQREEMRKILASIISNPEMFMAFLKFVQEYAKAMNYPCSTSDVSARELHCTSMGDCKTRHVTVRGRSAYELMRRPRHESKGANAQ